MVKKLLLTLNIQEMYKNSCLIVSKCRIYGNKCIVQTFIQNIFCSSTYKNPGQWYEMLQINSQEVFISSFFLFNWGILWTYWWQKTCKL